MGRASNIKLPKLHHTLTFLAENQEKHTIILFLEQYILLILTLLQTNKVANILIVPSTCIHNRYNRGYGDTNALVLMTLMPWSNS